MSIGRLDSKDQSLFWVVVQFDLG